MRYDNLLEPVSDDEPCGVDLELADDDNFLDYYFLALDRLPERYLDLTTGQPFDPAEVDLKGEVKEIGKLLEESRDLRLLGMEAQFQILAGKFDGFAEVVATMAALLETFPEDVHPQVDGDASGRRNAIESLDSRATVIMPLEHAILIRDKRLGQLSLRNFQVASGAKSAREDEESGDASAISSAFGSIENAEAVEALYETLNTLLSNFATMKTVSLALSDSPFSPQLENIEATTKSILAMLTASRTDLGGDDAPAEDAEAGVEGEASTDGGQVSQSAPPAGAIANHADATAALLAAENYFASMEPTAPALLLVRQSRLLIGRPLVEALEVLIPATAANAKIDFGTESGFNIGMERMRMLAQDNSGGGGGEAGVATTEFTAESRDQATGLIGSVESYFRTAEPSSPIPMLLFKAKGYMNRDFLSIVDDLMPSPA